MPKVDRVTSFWGTFLGFWGVLSGIGLFLTWDGFWRIHPTDILWELPVAALAAGVAEYAKARVEGHHESSVVGSILILIVLEFLLLGWHGPLNVETGHLKEISRRMLGTASATRPAKVYAFDIESPQQLRLQFAMADAGTSSQPPERARVAGRLLQLQPPDRRRVVLSGETPQPALDFALEDALNAGIRSVDYYRFVAGHDQHTPEEEDAHALPPRVEMERINREHIGLAFPGLIAPLPEAGTGEWLDLALGFVPLLVVGVVLGFVMVWIVVTRFHDTNVSDPNAMSRATLRGLGLGAVAGAGSAFAAFVACGFLVRLGYRAWGGSLLSAGWLAAPFTTMNAEIELCVEAGVRAALLFVLPGATLGALAPWLKPPSRQPRFWSLIAVGAAVLAVVTSLYSGGRYWWIAAAPILAFIIVRAIRANKALDFYWPVGALLVALFVCAVTVSAQVTLGDALRDVHLFIQKPSAPLAEALATRERPGGVTTRTIEQLAASADATARLKVYEQNETWKRAYDADRAREENETSAIGQALEISLVGGLGFWVTIAALIAWRRSA